MTESDKLIDTNMTEGLPAFSIFPDSHGSKTLGLKGGLNISKKKALQDVKNTLSSKQVAGKPFIGKRHAGGKANMNPPAKDLCTTSTPKEAFKINCDEDIEDYSFWDHCNCDENIEDFLPVIRPSSECFHDEDITYMMSGILRNIEPHEIVMPPDCLDFLEVDDFSDIPEYYPKEDLVAFNVIPVYESDDDISP